MRAIVPIAAIVAMLATPALAGIDIGPAIGSVAPALTAVDAAGAPQTLATLQARRGTVLVFFRSAKWCPFCQKQLIELKAAEAPLASRGYRLVAISYDAPETLATFAAKQGVTYPLLSDDKSRMINAYGILDPQYPAGHFANGVPKPAIFVIDRKGVVRAKLAEDGYRIRPPVEAVIATVDGLR